MSRRKITIEDLVGIRRIGKVHLSPDGRFATFAVIQPRLATNDFLNTIYLSSTDDSAETVVLSEFAVPPGSYPINEAPFTPLADTTWAKDGTCRCAFLVSSDGKVELRVRDVLLKKERAIPVAGSDIVLVGWNQASTQIVLSRTVEAAPVRYEAAIPDPAVRYFGQRVSTGAPWKKAEAPVARATVSVDVATGNISQNTPVVTRRERTVFEYPKVNARYNTFARGEALSPDGRFLAFITNFVTPETESSPPVLRGRNGMAVSIVPNDSTGQPRHLLLADVLRYPIHWSINSGDLLVVESQPDQSLIHRIFVDGRQSEVVHRTDLGLSEFEWSADGNTIVAVAEKPTVSPYLIAITLSDGREHTILRPNKNFDAIELPAPPRYEEVTTRYGHHFGVRITLPNDYTAGRSYPLVATTYVSGNAFQKGAVGDEFPVYCYTAAGFVVVSLNTSPDTLAPSQEGNLRVSQVTQLSPLDALEQIAGRLIEQGVVIPGRCGITGLSYGSEIVGYALLHSKLFTAAAAATANDTVDPLAYFLFDDQWREEALAARGLPFPDFQGLEAWRQVSVALNAGQVSMPLLIQPPDTEALPGMQQYHALRHAHVPVDMYVYPGEGHMKYGPQNKYWVYRRNLDWMRFWLQDVEDPSPEKREQYQHWRDLRHEWETLRERSAKNPASHK